MTRARIVILIYGLVSAALYCALLPLWEGFDELYHYGYVQYLSTRGRFPAVGQASLSRELWSSLDYVPISRYLQPHVERPSTSFEEYFRLSDAEREARRRDLDTMPWAFALEPSPRDNYEVKQAPFTYLLLAPLDRWLARAPLPRRVLTLRWMLAIASLAMLWIGARGLARRLQLPAVHEAAALFVIFSCQMLYATTCHIANDALLIPWLVFFLNSVIDACESPGLRRAAIAALLLAVGSLIKASALVFSPLFVAAPLAALLRTRQRWRLAMQLAAVTVGILAGLAGPWYIRNLVLYRNLTATLDTTSGAGWNGLLGAARSLDWRASIAAMTHTALWTGNNSFTTFSSLTLNLVLALLALAALLYALRFCRSVPEMVTAVAIALYCAGLALITLLFFSSSGGRVTAAEPWYMQILLAPVVMLCFLGLSRWRGRQWIAAATVLLWGYVAAATWVAKLIPLYGGFADPHARPSELLAWYLHDSSRRDAILASLCPAPLWLLFALLAALSGALLIACATVLRALARVSTLRLAAH